MATEITTSNFDELMNSGKPMLIDFWAEWCGPCQMLGPIIEEIAAEYEGRAIVGKCDVESNNAIAAKFGVRNIPYMVFIKNGELVDKQIGLTPKKSLTEKLDKIL